MRTDENTDTELMHITTFYPSLNLTLIWKTSLEKKLYLIVHFEECK